MNKGLNGHIAMLSTQIICGLNVPVGKRLKGFYCCFRKNGCINRAVLKEIFADILSEKQVREFISKTEDAGIIQKKGDW